MVTDLPSTSAAVGATRRLACPEHGFLPPGNVACTRCTKSSYDVDSADDRSMLQSLRGVARSSRMTRARILCFPVALIGLVLVLGPGAIALLLTPLLGEPMSRGVERGLRHLQPAPCRTLDRELL